MTGITTNRLDLFKDDSFLLSDFMNLFCGTYLGEGCSRIVYEYNIDPRYVIKIDKSNQFHNVSEWDLWWNLKNTEAGNFLSPCVHLSSCGRVMLQWKTKPIHEKDFPAQIPQFFADVKLDNWGMLRGKPVCHDYANHNFYSGKQKMIKSKVIY